jgi:hypothetical protein
MSSIVVRGGIQRRLARWVENVAKDHMPHAATYRLQHQGRTIAAVETAETRIARQ